MSDNNNKNNYRMPPPAAEPPAGLPPETSRRILQAGSAEEAEYEEEFEIQITTQKGSSIKIETSSYDKLDNLLDKAFTTYKRLTKEESKNIEKKQKYQ